MTQYIDRRVVIRALPFTVWETLTDPRLIAQWIGEPEMGVEVLTDWHVGGPIVIKGFHHVKFENRGIVMQCEREKVLQYSYLSSLSRLPDTPENHTIIEFRLMPAEGGTSLTVTLSNFPTESIFKHVDFYWRTTIELIKRVAEGRALHKPHSTAV